MREYESTKALIAKILRQLSSQSVRHVHVALGEICELNQSLIQNHWDEFSKGTPLEHAQLHFRLIDAEVQCMACFKKYHPVNGTIHCPHCGSFGAKILSGEEFHVETIETDNQ